MKILSSGVLVLLLMLPATAFSASYTYDGGASGLSASATFEVSGNNLIVTLTNTSLYDVTKPTEVLTAVFFTVAGDPTLSPSTALLPAGSTVFQTNNTGGTLSTVTLLGSGGSVGGEWAYGDGLYGMAPGFADEGISSTGLGLFGNGNFNPPTNLYGPDSVDGLQYGITSAGDVQNTGNGDLIPGGKAAGTKEGTPLIQNSVIFTLTGLPTGFSADLNTIYNVSFLYGTSLGQVFSVREPTTLILLGTGMIGFATWGRRRFRK